MIGSLCANANAAGKYQKHSTAVKKKHHNLHSTSSVIMSFRLDEGGSKPAPHNGFSSVNEPVREIAHGRQKSRNSLGGRKASSKKVARISCWCGSVQLSPLHCSDHCCCLNFSSTAERGHPSPAAPKETTTTQPQTLYYFHDILRLWMSVKLTVAYCVRHEII